MKNILKQFILAVFLVCLVSSISMAGDPVETSYGNTIMVVLGTTPWDSRVNHPQGLSIYKILFSPSAAGDILVIRDNGPLGNKIYPGKSTLGDGLNLDYPDEIILKPYILPADCTLGTPANAWVTLFIK